MNTEDENTYKTPSDFSTSDEKRDYINELISEFKEYNKEEFNKPHTEASSYNVYLTLSELYKKVFYVLTNVEKDYNRFLMSRLNSVVREWNHLHNRFSEIKTQSNAVSNVQLNLSEHYTITLEKFKANMKPVQRIERNLRDIKKSHPEKFLYTNNQGDQRTSRQLVMIGIGTNPEGTAVIPVEMTHYRNMKHFKDSEINQKVVDQINMYNIVKVYLVPVCTMAETIIRNNTKMFVKGNFDTSSYKYKTFKALETNLKIYTNRDPKIVDHFETILSLLEI